MPGNFDFKAIYSNLQYKYTTHPKNDTTENRQ